MAREATSCFVAARDFYDGSAMDSESSEPKNLQGDGFGFEAHVVSWYVWDWRPQIDDHLTRS